MKLQQWANWAEIAASVGVVVTLVFLLQEVRGNTLAIERQASLDRAASWTAPFFPSEDLPDILAKVKAVDGLNPGYQALVDRYDLTVEESILWDRHLASIWVRLETEYLYDGPSEGLERTVKGLLSNLDNQVYWEHQTLARDEFVEFVEDVTRD